MHCIDACVQREMQKYVYVDKILYDLLVTFKSCSLLWNNGIMMEIYGKKEIAFPWGKYCNRKLNLKPLKYSKFRN